MKTINHEDYVSLEIAKLLKEAGFNWEVKTYYNYLLSYDEYILKFDNISTNYNNINDACFSAPSLTVAQKWLREIKNAQCSIYWRNNIFAPYQWNVDSLNFEKTYYGSSNSYEKSLELSIKKALEIILNK